MPTLGSLRDEAMRVIERHPGLDIVLCHFFFMADDIDRADALLSAHPKVKLDLTPGSEMYYHFSRDPDAWSDFFNRYNERILFGSDSVVAVCMASSTSCASASSFLM